MKVTESCPTDTTEWRKKAEGLGCTQNKEYHCLWNQAKQLVEGCERPIWIQPGRCPEFNTPSQKLDSSRCRGQFCPSSVYKSNDVIKYKSCFSQNIATKTSASSTTASTVTTTASNNTRVQTTISHSGNGAQVPAIVVPVLVLILVGIVCIVIGLVWKKKRYCFTEKEPKAKTETPDREVSKERKRFTSIIKCWESQQKQTTAEEDSELTSLRVDETKSKEEDGSELTSIPTDKTRSNERKRFASITPCWERRRKNRTSNGKRFTSITKCWKRRQQNQTTAEEDSELTSLRVDKTKSKEEDGSELTLIPKDKKGSNEDAPSDSQCMNIVEDHFSHKEDHYSETIPGEIPTLSVLSDIVENLLKTRTVAIIGNWDSYKSTIAMQTIERAIAEKGLQHSRVISVTDIKTICLPLEDDIPLFLYLKNCIKNWSTSNYITAMVQKIKQIRENRKGITYILLTMRSGFWEMIRSELNKNIQCIDLNSPETFTQNDRFAILQWHMNKCSPTGKNNMHSQPHVGQITRVILNYKKPIFQGNSIEIGFIPMVSILCNNKHIQKNMESFMKNPYAFLKNDLEGKSESTVIEDRCQFAVLVYGMLKGGMFFLNRENDYDLLTKIFDLYSVKDKLEKLLITPPCDIDYLGFIPEKKSYLIKHSIVVRILFQIVSKKHTELLVKHCNEKLLLDCIVVNEGLRKGCTKDIVERFRMIYDNGQKDIMDHLYFEDRNFSEMFSKKP